MKDSSQSQGHLWQMSTFGLHSRRLTTSLAPGRSIGWVFQQSSMRYHISSSKPWVTEILCEGRDGLTPWIILRVIAASLETSQKGTLPVNICMINIIICYQQEEDYFIPHSKHMQMNRCHWPYGLHYFSPDCHETIQVLATSMYLHLAQLKMKTTSKLENLQQQPGQNLQYRLSARKWSKHWPNEFISIKIA